ncbi:hypothetical protein [Hymenobacter sediminicola]|uniref:Uncharacterized protein n=1 Tax=Hymenobacter sediminicola TaxID=2761579 RepID=A0A7G7W8U3_9BACT|nr:hypothetical protein [Hymenobacter sediminicola]QNH62786.1 hypothetical protein H4317_02900 [Hymenobacter sediminicola]
MANIIGDGQYEESHYSATVHKLIYVGSPFKDTKSDIYAIPCYFQPWLHTKNLPADLPISAHLVNGNKAGELVCGSLWTDTVGTSKPIYHNNSDFEVFWTGSKALFAVLLKNVINPGALSPSSFWIKKGDTWIICIEFNNKKIIIPYFELLRVLFYQASKRLTQFFLSYLPLELLCRPLVFPGDDKSLLARFYVASENLKESEARVLGGLLFDPSLKQIFDLSQNHWLSTGNALTPKKLAGKFSKSILLHANGYNFNYNNEQYFWVDSLKIVNSPYNFKHLLFHPIGYNKANSLSISNPVICSDLLEDNINHCRLMPLQCCLHGNTDFGRKLSTSRNKRSKKHLFSVSSILPSVTCALPWATLPVAKSKFLWLDRALAEQVQHVDKNLYESAVKCTPAFRKLLKRFTANGHAVKLLSLNNPDGIFGINASILPVDGHTVLPLAFHRKLTGIFTVAEVSLGNGPIFLAQPFPEKNPNLILLCQKQNLTHPSDLEWNNLFSIVHPIHDSRDYAVFYKNCSNLNRGSVSTNSALIAHAIPLNKITVDLCVSSSNHLLSRFRKRLQFYVATNLKHPAGVTDSQRGKITRLSANICRAPDSLWTAAIYSLWLR